MQPKNGTIAREPCISVTSLTKPSSHSTIISAIERTLMPSSGTIGSAAPAIERARDESEDEQDAHHDPGADQDLGNLAAADQFEKIYRLLQFNFSDAAILAF